MAGRRSLLAMPDAATLPCRVYPLVLAVIGVAVGRRMPVFVVRSM